REEDLQNIRDFTNGSKKLKVIVLSHVKQGPKRFCNAFSGTVLGNFLIDLNIPITEISLPNCNVDYYKEGGLVTQLCEAISSGPHFDPNNAPEVQAADSFEQDFASNDPPEVSAAFYPVFIQEFAG